MVDKESLEILLQIAAEEGWDEPVNIKNKQESIQAEDDEEKEVIEATSFSSEDFHGGNEATNSIEDSSSNSKNGKNEKNEEETGDKSGSDSNKKSNDFMSKMTEKMLFENGIILPVSDEITEAIKRIAKNEVGKKNKEPERWDVKRMVKHLTSSQKHKIINDKIYNKEANSVLLFIDLSGSFNELIMSVREAIKLLSQKGFKVTVMDIGNGFKYNKESEVTVGSEDPFNSRNRLAKIIENTTAKLHPIYTSPSIETGVKLVNNAEFSVILADYDGFESFNRLSFLCDYEKIPYFFDLETRYDDPSEHDWVEDGYDIYADPYKWWNFQQYCVDAYSANYDNDDYEDDEDY
jgi:hypothetical protein